MHAFSHAFPELGHNEIVGWEGADGRGFAIVALRDPDESEAIRRRIDVTLDVARPHATAVAAVEGLGDSRTARAFNLVATGDWVTYHAALARGVDPTPVAAIAALKQALSE
jgi:glucose/mannose-6-phosphate isomerase